MEEMSFFYDNFGEIPSKQEEEIQANKLKTEESAQPDKNFDSTLESGHESESDYEIIDLKNEENSTFSRLDKIVNEINEADKNSKISIKTIAILLRILFGVCILFLFYILLIRLPLSDLVYRFFSKELNVINGKVDL